MSHCDCEDCKARTLDRVSSWLLEIDDYDLVVERFNELDHDGKFAALSNEEVRGYLYRATSHGGRVTMSR